MTFLIAALVTFVSLVLYIGLGILVSATVFKRDNASWKWWGSNIAEFFLAAESFGIISIALYLAVWPFWIALELGERAFLYVKEQWNNRGLVRRSRITMDAETVSFDFESNNAYPHIVYNYTSFSSNEESIMNLPDDIQIIKKMIDEKPGIKGVELVTEYINHVHSIGGDPNKNILEVINTLVKRGEIIEIEYVLPTMNYRVKSMYFPKGTEVRVVTPSEGN